MVTVDQYADGRALFNGMFDQLDQWNTQRSKDYHNPMSEGGRDPSKYGHIDRTVLTPILSHAERWGNYPYGIQ